MKDAYSLVILPGDGIGVEVTREAVKTLQVVEEIVGAKFDKEEIECGGHYYVEHGVEWPEDSFEKCVRADAILAIHGQGRYLASRHLAARRRNNGRNLLPHSGLSRMARATL